MSLIAWQATVQDDEGNVIVNPSITVRRASDDGLADIFDADGVALANPFEGSTEGFVQFFAQPGRYTVQGARGGSVTQTWTVDLSSTGVIYVDTIADLTALNTAVLPDGQQASVAEYHAGTNRGGGTFVYDKASSATADGGKVFAASGGGRWVRNAPASRFQVDWYGALGDGATSDVAPFQACIDAAVATQGAGGWQIVIPDTGKWFIDDELSFEAQTVEEKTYFGGEIGKAFLLIHPMGGAKKVFKWNNQFKCRCEWRNIQIQPSGGESTRKNWPTLFWLPRTSVGCLFDNIDSNNGGYGTFLVSDEVFNTDVKNCNLFSAGWQPLRKEVSSSCRVGVSGTTVTATENIFTSSDVGELFYVDNAGAAESTLRNGFVSKIASVTSGTEVELEDAVISNRTSELSSFGVLTGSTTSGSAILTCSGPHGLEASDVGRQIYVDRAAGDDRVLAATVTSIPAGDQIEISRNVGQTVEDQRLWFTPMFAVGKTLVGSVPATGERVNDLKLESVLIENYRGVGFLSCRGPNVFFDHIKVHARPRTVNNYAVSSAHLVFSENQNVMINHAQLEHGQLGVDGGYITMRGGNAVLSDFVLTRPNSGSPLFDCAFDAGDSWLVIGSGRYNGDFNAARPPNITRTTLALDMAKFPLLLSTTGLFRDLKDAAQSWFSRYQQAAGFISGLVQLDNGEVYEFPPPKTHGFISVLQEHKINAFAMLRFRTSSSPAFRGIEIGTDAEAFSSRDLTVNGGAAELSVSVNKDAIQLQNNSGVTRSFTYTIWS